MQPVSFVTECHGWQVQNSLHDTVNVHPYDSMRSKVCCDFPGTDIRQVVSGPYPAVEGVA